ncbi:hypothetical protein [Nakamurella lactea]|uniref:hypothetical protein n=1 Tax=Nakamurella lactea TaxID=459515 RepID=UPI00040F1C72|nr:hypothetical protein [Nakamurella lactea]
MTQAYDESVAETSHSDIQGVISGLEASLTDLGGFVSAVKSSWDGDEMEQYNQIQSTWNNSSAAVSEILRAVHTALGSKTGSVKQMRGAVLGALATQS